MEEADEGATPDLARIDDGDATEYAEQIRVGFEKKADHNKAEALLCFMAVIAATLVAPVFVMLGTGTVCGKVIPSILSLAAAGTTTWLQLRKPQQLWALYRTCQRRIEDEQTGFRYRLSAYSKNARPARLLAKRVADVAMFAHEQWIPLVPSPENLGALSERREQRATKDTDGTD